MSTQSGNWLPLMEYAMRKGVSLSTLRRYIKSRKVEYRLEDGRYLLWDPEAAPSSFQGRTDAKAAVQTQAVAMASSGPESQSLQVELKRAHEEISELKTLIALYEEQMMGSGKDSH